MMQRPMPLSRIFSLSVIGGLIVAILAMWAAAAFGQTSPELVALGQKLFFDPRLSPNRTVACVTCHLPERGFTDGRSIAVGFGGRLGQRNTPTILETGFQQLSFWDGRVEGVARQAIQPLTNPNELGNQTRSQVYRRIGSLIDYQNLFTAAFGSPAINDRTFSVAIRAFEQSIVLRDAKIDRRLAGYSRALSTSAERGFALFSRLPCMECHVPPSFTDGAFHNTGITFFTGTDDQGRIAIVPPAQRVEDSTQRRAFKTPTLREVQRTAPYMHNGTVADLASVVAGYNLGWQRNGQRDARADPRIVPLGLTAEQMADLTEFLSTAFRSESLETRPIVFLPAR